MATSFSKLASKYPRLMSELAMLTLEAGEPKKAAKILNKFLKRFPEDTAGLLVQGAIEEYLGEFESADKIYRDIVKREPNNIRAITRLYIMAKDRKDPSDYWKKNLIMLDPLSPLLADYVFVPGEEEPETPPVEESTAPLETTEGADFLETVETSPTEELPPLDTIQEKLETLEKSFEALSEDIPLPEAPKETLEIQPAEDIVPKVAEVKPAQEIIPPTPEIIPPASEITSSTPEIIPVEMICPEETLESGVQISLEDLKIDMELSAEKASVPVETKVVTETPPSIEAEVPAEVEPIISSPEPPPEPEKPTIMDEFPPLEAESNNMSYPPTQLDLDEFKRIYSEIDENQTLKKPIPETVISEPIPSVTLAELYALQGNIKKALEIYSVLPEEDLLKHAERIKELTEMLNNPTK